MLKINKITSSSVVDYAAEELKKYLRMMMPEDGDIKISYNPNAKDGFRLGLMQDFGLDVSDAKDASLDDILYIDCDEAGGIIAGDNPRSVLLSVYEYLRQNGCRWLFPGVDGEYIPMQNIKAVKYRHKPTCRYRGWCNEGAEFQQCMMDTIDFIPKVGMNVYMLEFKIPTYYYDLYYSHKFNEENRTAEPISPNQVLQWKRQCEAEISKRSLQFHDIGHGWTTDSFGIDAMGSWSEMDTANLTEETLQYLPLMNGKRGLFRNQPINTNFCMSNPKARALFAKNVANYAESQSNADYIHVWLADARNNHCECDECRKMRPSDWYVTLMNDIDEELTKRELDTRIVFIQYLDTTWAPKEIKIKNPARFTMLVAPITRSYEVSLPSDVEYPVASEYVRNNNVFPKNLGEYMAHYNEWRKMWHGSNVSYEYHFWVHQSYDLSGIHLARIINDDVRSYKAQAIDGIIEDGSQRSFFPTGLAFYSYARSLYDATQSADEIIEEYFSCAFGENWKKFYDYLSKIGEAMPFRMLTLGRFPERHHEIVSEENVKLLSTVKDVVAEGRELIKEYYNSDARVRTVSVRLLEKHAEYCEGLSEVLIERAKGNIDEAMKKFDEFRISFGKREAEIQSFYDQIIYFTPMRTLVGKSKKEMEINL